MRKITFNKTEAFNPLAVLSGAIGNSTPKGYSITDIKMAIDIKGILEASTDNSVTLTEPQWDWLKRRFSEQSWTVAAVEILDMQTAITDAESIPA